MHRLFAFGTLKRGFQSHNLISAARFAGDAVSARPAYTLVAVPWDGRRPGEFFPGLMNNGNGYIKGEIYEDIDDALLARLDEFEETGTDYEREMIDLADGTQAWTYIFVNRANLPTIKKHPQIGYDAGALIFNWINNPKELLP